MWLGMGLQLFLALPSYDLSGSDIPSRFSPGGANLSGHSRFYSPEGTRIEIHFLPGSAGLLNV